MILALILLGVQVLARQRADDETLSEVNGFFDLTYGDEYTSLSIYPASAWHSSYIVPDNNYASEALTISIYFRLDGVIDITNSYAEFTHPAAADFDDCVLSKLLDGDWKAVCDISSLDTAGTYGPISLVIRTSDNNQIIAEDVAYGYFALLGDEPADGVLTISFSSDEEAPVYTVQESVTLKFDVTIDVEMYFGDYFILDTDSSFGFDNLVLKWVDDVDGNAHFNETMVEVHVDAAKNVYIYGFSGELTESATISFTLSGFSAPVVINSGGAYSFDLEVHRFGTNTMSKRYVGDGPSDAVVAGKVEIVSWAPVNTAIAAATDLHVELVTWFKLIVKADHDVPATGTIVFAFTGVKLNTYTFASDNNQEKVAAGTIGISTDNSDLVCTAEEAAVTCTASSIITAGSSISVYNLLEITASLVISSVTTKSPSATIDENTTGKTISLPETGNALTMTYARIATSIDDATGVNTIMLNDANYGILVGFQLPAIFTGGTDSFNIHLPFTTGETWDSTKLVIKSTASIKKVASATEVTIENGSVLDLADTATQALGTNQITVVVAANAATVAADQYFYAFIGSTTLGTNKLYLPKIPTQMSQMAEIVLKLKIGTEYYLYASPLYFDKATLAVAPTIALACTNAVVAGMPATLTYTPDAYTVPSGYTLKVQLTVANVNFLTGSGLTAGEVFPGSLTTYKVDASGNLYIDGLTSLTAAAISINVPLPALTTAGTSLTLQPKVYLVPSSGSNILLFSRTSAAVATTAAVETAVFTLPDDTTKAVGASYDLVVTLAIGYDDATDPADEEQAVFFILLFPYGYSTTDSDLEVKLAPANSMFPYFYAYKSIAAAGYTEDVGGGTKTISITVPWFEDDTTVNLFSGKGSLSTFTGLACDQDSIIITTDSAASLTFGSYSPATAKGKTYSNPDVDVTLTLTSTRAIVKGTTFASTLNYWTGCTTTYTISGKTENPTTVAYPANTAITIKLSGCTLPTIAAGADSITIKGFTTVTGSYDSNIYLRWTEPDTKTQTVISSNTAISGKVSSAKLWAFPNVAGAVDAYFGISFTLDATIPLIPAGSSIEIDGDFSDDSDLANNLWTSFKYSSASISAGVLTLVNANEIAAKSTLKVVKDLAFDIADNTPDTVLVTITTGDVDIILDVSTTQKYSVQAEPAGEISFVIEASDATAGFVSAHEFAITFGSASEAESVWVHLDATNYNAIVGPVIIFEDLPEILFLYAFDSEGDFIVCFTNHWVTSCGFEGPIEEDAVLEFSIWVQNADETGSWGIFVTDDELKYLYQPAYTSTDFTFNNDLSNDIDLYFATADFSDNEDQYMHDLVLSAFVDIEATSGSEFTVQFPSPYDFTEYPSDTIACDIVYHQLGDNDEVEEVPVLEEAECSVMNGMVSFTLTADQTFTADFWTHFTIYDVLTPEFVYDNSRESEHEYNPDEKMFYSENFCILYSTVADGYVSASFDNLNAAFVGFTEGTLEPLVVNGGKTLLVTPGTWSGPYQITNLAGKFQAESVLITWDSEDFIELDESSYTLDFKDKVAEFWIGVPSDEEIISDIYVIEWEIDETPFDGIDADYYARPRNTLVEISRELQFSVVLNPPVIYVPTKGWSMPINLQFEKGEGRDIKSYPYESIEITFAEDDDLELSFRPNPLVLDMETTAGFVSIQCLGCTSGTEYPFVVTVEGDDSEAFVMSKSSYVFKSGSRYSTAATFSIETSEALASEFSLSIKTNQVGVATWTLISEQNYEREPNQTSYEYIVENSFILGAAQNSKGDLESLKEKHSSQIKELDEEYKDYEELTKRKLSLSRNIYYSAQSMVITEGTTTLLADLTGLAPKTKYLVYLYFDNFDGSEPVQKIKEVTTARTPSHATLKFTFTGEQTEEELAAALKKIFGLPEANYNLKGANLDRRLADSSTVTVYSDTSSSTSAYDTAKTSETDIESSTSSTVDVGEISDDEETAEFKEEPTWDVDNGIYLVLNFSSSVDGYVYCTAEGNGSELTSDQVYESVNADGDIIPQFYDTINSGDNDLIMNFTAHEDISTFGTYRVSCIVCNDFPGTPDCSDEVKSQSYEYTGEEDNSDDDSGAEALVVAFAAYFLF